jgi:hypothetical protein
MNKQILLKSVGSVAGFLALFCAVLYVAIWSLEYYPELSAPFLIILLFGWMVWFEYKNRMDRREVEIMARLKNGIK